MAAEYVCKSCVKVLRNQNALRTQVILELSSCRRLVLINVGGNNLTTFQTVPLLEPKKSFLIQKSCPNYIYG